MTTTEQVISYDDTRARSETRNEALDAITALRHIVDDLNAGRVPSNTYARTAAAAVADVSRGVGAIAAYDGVRRALRARQED